jgi:protoporphyrinogen oxidase
MRYGRNNPRANAHARGGETSLIEFFLYPKYGPGHLWELVQNDVESMGGDVLMGHAVTKLNLAGDRIASVEITDLWDGTTSTMQCDYVFSTAPVKELTTIISPPPPAEVLQIGQHLQYRDFITVGILLRNLAPSMEEVTDNWIYVHEPGVHVCRIQIFNNWSPYLVAKSDTVWVGLEYITSEDTDLWRKTDEELKQLAIQELVKIDFARQEDVLDATVIRIKKTYPAYFGVYDHFPVVQRYLESIKNLYPIGRNGMHKYNNQDHSMLTAMTAVDNIVAKREGKKNVC